MSNKMAAVHFDDEDVSYRHLNESFGAFGKENKRPHYVILGSQYNEHWIIDENIENLSNEAMCELAQKQKEKIYDKRRQEYDEARIDNETGKIRRGKRPKKEKCFHDAIVVVDEHHTIEDIVKVGKMIEAELGYTLYAASLHKDEGRFEYKDTGERVNNVLYNQKDGCYYLKDEQGKDIKIADSLAEMGEKFNIKFNDHAHLHFVTLRKEGQMRRINTMRHKLAGIQTKAAEILGMKRGEFGSKKKHLKRNEYIAVSEAHTKNQNIIKECQAELEKKEQNLDEFIEQRAEEMQGQTTKRLGCLAFFLADKHPKIVKEYFDEYLPPDDRENAKIDFKNAINATFEKEYAKSIIDYLKELWGNIKQHIIRRM